MKIDSELFDLCREFVKENRITPEDDGLDDVLYGDITAFIHQICELVGYYEEDEDQDELDFED